MTTAGRGHRPPSRASHWDSAYARGPEGTSWYQQAPRLSLELIDALGVERDVAVVDVGGGASTLVDHLTATGFADVTVLDVSATALAETRRRLGPDVPARLLEEDVLAWRPQRRFGLWHDRALIHFLVDPADRRAYLRTLHAGIEDGGFVVLASFAPDGPPSCSGLPVCRYSAEELVELLGAGFTPLETRREEHRTPGGSIQPFTWVAGRLEPASAL